MKLSINLHSSVTHIFLIINTILILNKKKYFVSRFSKIQVK